MSLLEFMKYIAEHPDHLRVYKRDPDAFFQQLPSADCDRIALSEEERQAIDKYQHAGFQEQTTIMRLIIKPSTQVQYSTPNPSGIKDLSSLYVDIQAVAYNDVFFVEPPIASEDNRIAACMTLPHSYIYIDKVNVYFDLHLCYTDPDDLRDLPQVLYISTGLKPEVVGLYGYQEAKIIITDPPGYILVLPPGNSKRTTQRLCAGSQYDYDSHQLTLVFDHRDPQHQ